MALASLLFIEMLTDQQPHLALLSLDRARRVDHGQPKFGDHAVILFQNLSLKNRETLFRLVRPAKVHPCFVILQIRSSRHDAIDGDVERCSEKESYGGLHRKRVNVSYPG